MRKPRKEDIEFYLYVLGIGILMIIGADLLRFTLEKILG